MLIQWLTLALQENLIVISQQSSEEVVCTDICVLCDDSTHSKKSKKIKITDTLTDACLKYLS